MITTGINAEIIESNTREALISGLFLHSQKYCVPKTLLVDAGSSIHPKPGSKLYQKYFGSQTMEVIQLAACHQRLSYVESHIKTFKSILKTCFLSRNRLNLPSLTYQELRCIISAVCTLLNSRTIKNPLLEETFLTANHFCKPHWLLSSEKENIFQNADLNFLQSNLQLLYDQMKGAQDIFIKTLKESFVSCSKRHLRNSKYDNPFKPQDIALQLKTISHPLCQIIQPHGQYCTVLSAEKIPPIKKTVHCAHLILLFRPFKDNDGEDLTNFDGARCQDQAPEDQPGGEDHAPPSHASLTAPQHRRSQGYKTDNNDIHHHRIFYSTKYQGDIFLPLI